MLNLTYINFCHSFLCLRGGLVFEDCFNKVSRTGWLKAKRVRNIVSHFWRRQECVSWARLLLRPVEESILSSPELLVAFWQCLQFLTLQLCHYLPMVLPESLSLLVRLKRTPAIVDSVPTWPHFNSRHWECFQPPSSSSRRGLHGHGATGSKDTLFIGSQYADYLYPDIDWHSDLPEGRIS